MYIALYKFFKFQGPETRLSDDFSSTQFQACFKPVFTLFSKFFPSFFHSICQLQVSRQYLAVDGVYHPIWPAFPSKQTPRLWSNLIMHTQVDQTPLWQPVPRMDLYQGMHKSAPIDYNSEDFRLDIFPVHSSLLGNLCQFLFLGLVICLSSVHSLVWFVNGAISLAASL